MKLKTFQIRLCRPFGSFTKNAYTFYLHAQDHHEALAWIERVFTGIDTKPTLYRWSGGAVSPIGNSDPVSIGDCDHFCRTQRKGGVLDRLPQQPGEFRKSADQIADEIERIVSKMSDEHQGFVASFYSMAKDYERNPRAWVYERLAQFKAGAERSALWRDNLSQQLVRMRPPLAMVMPEIAHERAA